MEDQQHIMEQSSSSDSEHDHEAEAGTVSCDEDQAESGQRSEGLQLQFEVGKNKVGKNRKRQRRVKVGATSGPIADLALWRKKLRHLKRVLRARNRGQQANVNLNLVGIEDTSNFGLFNKIKLLHEEIKVIKNAITPEMIAEKRKARGKVKRKPTKTTERELPETPPLTVHRDQLRHLRKVLNRRMRGKSSRVDVNIIHMEDTSESGLLAMINELEEKIEVMERKDGETSRDSNQLAPEVCSSPSWKPHSDERQRAWQQGPPAAAGGGSGCHGGRGYRDDGGGDGWGQQHQGWNSSTPGRGYIPTPYSEWERSAASNPGPECSRPTSSRYRSSSHLLTPAHGDESNPTLYSGRGGFCAPDEWSSDTAPDPRWSSVPTRSSRGDGNVRFHNTTTNAGLARTPAGFARDCMYGDTTTHGVHHNLDVSSALP